MADALDRTLRSLTAAMECAEDRRTLQELESKLRQARVLSEQVRSELDYSRFKQTHRVKAASAPPDKEDPDISF